MFVFGVNLPVMEIMFVAVALFILALVIIIVQLVKMNRHINVLDDTTLEIRRYDEEAALRVEQPSLDGLSDQDVADFKKKVLPAFAKAQQAVATKALNNALGAKSELMQKGLSEVVAARLVNNVSLLLREYKEHGLKEKDFR